MSGIDAGRKAKKKIGGGMGRREILSGKTNAGPRYNEVPQEKPKKRGGEFERTHQRGSPSSNLLRKYG